MAGNQNPFKPKDTKAALLRSLAAGSVVAFIFIVISLLFKVNGYTAFSVIMLSFVFTAYKVWQRQQD